uniref:Uncharacterized protein n=1 Tax=Gouania willdenowi TaxID=441366 RepID=A0A8C5E1T8_GOUWI
MNLKCRLLFTMAIISKTHVLWTFFQQCAIALCAFAVTLLAPAGWILHHMPEYRKKSPPTPD